MMADDADARSVPGLPTQYRVEGELGSGGMAVVYGAVDVRHERRVAIKVLRREISATVGSERFLREIRIAAQLTHPHILPLIDSGESGGLLYYVMPRVDGESLRSRLVREGELPIREAIRILRDLLDALAYAHARGVVHRDIKPENVLLSDRHALVADFGIAKALGVSWAAETVVGTAVGTMLGTPAYMAPEQVSGLPTLDHRADIYAIGLLAYEMLTARLPFRADTPQQFMAAHVVQQPDPLAQWRPAVPPRLAAAVAKCLEKRPADRWQSAAELLAQIEATAAEISTPAAVAASSNQIVECRFALSERVCRKLNRATLDPRIIGDHLQYVDNQMSSDVLVFFLHGLGLDHRDFEPVLQRLPYRGMSPTLFGGEPGRQVRPALALNDHIVILREWLADVIERARPSIVVMVGFSLGADMGFELLRTPKEEPPPRVDAFLSLGSNLSIETTFVSRVMAGISSDRPEKLVADLCRLGSVAATLDEWVNIHEYLVKVLRKFQGDVAPLQRSAADIVRLLAESQGFEIFTAWFRTARERLSALRLIFSGDGQTRKMLDRLKLENLDSGILGEEYPDDTIIVLPHADHFDLMTTDHVLRFVGELVAEVLVKRETHRRESSPSGDDRSRE